MTNKNFIAEFRRSHPAGVHAHQSDLFKKIQERKIDDAQLAAHLQSALTLAAVICHGLAFRAGWWTDREGALLPPDFPAKVALSHSELSEAFEGWRRNASDEHIPDRTGAEVEWADHLIRGLDVAGAGFLAFGRPVDVPAAAAEKLLYNTTRADHRREAREAEGGKRV